MSSNPDKPLPVLASELWDLVRRYAQQETIEPIKGLGRYAAFGLAGSVLVGIGVVELAVGLLRVLQTETGEVFDDSWSWAPYLIVVAVCAVVAVLALSRTRVRRGARP